MTEQYLIYCVPFKDNLRLTSLISLAEIGFDIKIRTPITPNGIQNALGHFFSRIRYGGITISSYEEASKLIKKINPIYKPYIIKISEDENENIKSFLDAEKDMEELRLLKEII